MYRHTDKRNGNRPEKLLCDKCKKWTETYINIFRVDIVNFSHHKMIKGDLFEQNFCPSCILSIISDEINGLCQTK